MRATCVFLVMSILDSVLVNVLLGDFGLDPSNSVCAPSHLSRLGNGGNSLFRSTAGLAYRGDCGSPVVARDAELLGLLKSKVERPLFKSRQPRPLSEGSSDGAVFDRPLSSESFRMLMLLPGRKYSLTCREILLARLGGLAGPRLKALLGALLGDRRASFRACAGCTDCAG